MFLKEDKTKTRPDEVLNPDLWAIVLSYSHEYMHQMLTFCRHHRLDACFSILQEKYNINSKNLAHSTQVFLNKEKQTALIVADAEANIQTRINAMTVENATHLAQKIQALRQSAQPQLEALCQEMVAVELQLLQKKQEEEHLAQLALEAEIARLRQIGFIAIELDRQAEAKTDLNNTRMEVAQSDLLFEEVFRMTALLEDFPKAMDEEISHKKGWNNRFLRVRADELDALFWQTRTTTQLVVKCLTMGLLIWLGIVVVGTIAPFGFVLLGVLVYFGKPTPKEVVFMSAIYVSQVFVASFWAIVGALYLLNTFSSIWIGDLRRDLKVIPFHPWFPKICLHNLMKYKKK